MTKDQKLPLLDESLIRALELIDSQIARAMERTPEQREKAGVQKWKPLEERIERLSTLILDNFGEKVQLDSILVMSQVMVKVLGLLCQEMGQEGLGELRSLYVQESLKILEIEIERSIAVFKDEKPMLM
jgi:hypothetical protein